MEFDIELENVNALRNRLMSMSNRVYFMQLFEYGKGDYYISQTLTLS